MVSFKVVAIERTEIAHFIVHTLHFAGHREILIDALNWPLHILLCDYIGICKIFY
jgi:hypothetical protein